MKKEFTCTNRRTILRTAGAGLVATFAGCSSSDENRNEPASDPSPTETARTTETSSTPERRDPIDKTPEELLITVDDIPKDGYNRFSYDKWNPQFRKIFDGPNNAARLFVQVNIYDSISKSASHYTSKAISDVWSQISSPDESNELNLAVEGKYSLGKFRRAGNDYDRYVSFVKFRDANIYGQLMWAINRQPIESEIVENVAETMYGRWR